MWSKQQKVRNYVNRALPRQQLHFFPSHPLLMCVQNHSLPALE